MNKENYFEERVDDQINWYNKKSQRSQRMFKRLRFIEIFSAALIPLVAGFGEEFIPVPLIVGILGVIVLLMSALTSLNKYQEHWIQYRTTCETLKHEKFLFITKTEPYNTESPFPLFVKRVESLISKEHSAWVEHTKKGIEETKEITNLNK